MKKQLIIALTFGFHGVCMHADGDIATKNITKQPNLAATTQMTLKDVTNNLKDLNIRFINCFDAMQECDAGIEVQKELKGKQESLMKDLQADEQKIRQAATEYNSKKGALSDGAREKEEKSLRKMEVDYKAKLQESEYELKLAMQKSTELLAKDIEEAVAVVAKQNHLDAVVDTMTGRVVYASERVNITDNIVKEMNVQRDYKLAQMKEVKKDTRVAQVSDKKADTAKA